MDDAQQSYMRYCWLGIGTEAGHLFSWSADGLVGATILGGWRSDDERGVLFIDCGKTQCVARIVRDASLSNDLRVDFSRISVGPPLWNAGSTGVYILCNEGFWFISSIGVIRHVVGTSPWHLKPVDWDTDQVPPTTISETLLWPAWNEVSKEEGFVKLKILKQETVTDISLGAKALTTGWFPFAASISVAQKSGRLSAVIESLNAPADVWVAEHNGDDLRQITNLNPQLEARDHDTDRIVQWKDYRGRDIWKAF